MLKENTAVLEGIQTATLTLPELLGREVNTCHDLEAVQLTCKMDSLRLELIAEQVKSGQTPRLYAEHEVALVNASQLMRRLSDLLSNNTETLKQCRRCDGRGDLFGKDGLTVCPFCEGTGFKVVQHATA